MLFVQISLRFVATCLTLMSYSNEKYAALQSIRREVMKILPVAGLGSIPEIKARLLHVSRRVLAQMTDAEIQASIIL